MGRHNIDTDFGEKLKDREIAPKAASWEKLNSRLENDTKRSGSHKWILGIAASLVAGILILGQVYRTNGVQETPSVVETPVEIQKENNISRDQQDSQLAIEEIQNPDAEEEIQNPVAQEDLQHKKPIKNTPAPQKVFIAQTVNEAETNQETVVAEITQEEKKEIMPAGLEDAIAAVSSNLAKNDDLAEAEVDSLLMLAASQISRERTSYLAGENIDAESLLWDVEMEMDQSFREKVFEVMKEGYLKARTAVANRNY